MHCGWEGGLEPGGKFCRFTLADIGLHNLQADLDQLHHNALHCVCNYLYLL